MLTVCRSSKIQSEFVCRQFVGNSWIIFALDKVLNDFRGGWCGQAGSLEGGRLKSMLVQSSRSSVSISQEYTYSSAVVAVVDSPPLPNHLVVGAAAV